MEDYLEINSNTKDKTNKIKLVPEKYLHNNYFQETAKLWKEYDSKIKLIENINSGRKFFKKGKDKPSYFEIFEDPRTKAIGISEKISFLYAPLAKDNSNYDKSKCIGFRYYELNRNERCNYFTLVNKYDNRFFILEKDKNIFDFKGVSFYDEKLNCYSVMKNIVFEKYKKEIVFPKGDFLPEIIGFSYSLISLGKIKGFHAVEPLILIPLNDESRIERLPDELEENIGYIEPIMFDNHVSVALIKKSKIKNRVNIVLDMSRYHIEGNLSDNTVFPEELYRSNYTYPKYSIQKGNSCGLWFFGIVECIYSNAKYKNIDDVCLAINKKKATFFIDVINCLSNILYEIPNIIDDSSLETSLDVKENRVYEIGQISTYSFRKEAVKSYFFSLASLFSYYENNKNWSDEKKINSFDLLLEYQYLIDDITNFLSRAIFNDNYFKIYSPKNIYEKEQKEQYKQLIQSLKALLNKVNINYEKEFNNLLYKQFEDNLNYGIMIDKRKILEVYDKLKKTLSKTDKIHIIEINALKNEFEKIKYLERNIVIKEESTISKYLNPNNEFYFQMMIH